MNSFTPIPNRDAHASIRGYAYQVDTTIKRWLDLNEDEQLMLECGEDIDKIFCSDSGKSISLDRELEQVKHREKNITLRSNEIVGAIASFIAHKRNNPGQKISFKFTTNSKVVCERPAIIPDGQPALKIWQSIYKNEIVKPDSEQLCAIRNELKSREKPGDINEDTWGAFGEFIEKANDKDIYSLIKEFEIATDFPDAISISNDLLQELIDKNFAADLLQAKEIFYRLFYRVIYLLSQNGEKILTNYELIEEIRKPTLSSNDHKEIENIRNILKNIVPRMDSMEEDLKQITPRINTMEENVNDLLLDSRAKAGIGDDTHIQLYQNFILDIPPLVKARSYRADTVNKLIERFEKCNWISLYGGIGEGKTQLAILIAQKLECIAWLHFRDLSINNSCVLLKKALETISSKDISNSFDFGRFCDEILKSVKKNTLIVLDDLPRLEGDDLLSERLIILSSACSKNSVNILSTSVNKLFPRISDKLSDDLLYEMKVPLITDQEAHEILHAYGGTEKILTAKFCSGMNSLAQNHPALLVALANYFNDIEWKFDDQFFKTFFSSEYASDVKEKAFCRLIEKISHKQSKELLYRLSLFTSTFSFDLVQRLSRISPTIEHPRESFIPLDGLWIQKEDRNHFRLSPLIYRVGDTELTTDLKQKCHLSIAEWLIERRTISIVEAAQIFSHFTLAGKLERAAHFLIYILQKINEYEKKVEHFVILFIWWNMPIPDEINLGYKIIIRSLQISIGYKQGKNLDYLINDLEDMVDNADIYEAVPLAVLVGSNIQLLARHFPSKAYRFLQKALKILADSRMNKEIKQILSSSSIPLETLVWTIAWTTYEKIDLDSWFNLMEQLTPDQLKIAYSEIYFYELACYHIATAQLATAQWLQEEKKAECDQKWEIVLQKLSNIGMRAKQIGAELLWAWSIHSQTVIYGEYLNDLSKCVEIGRNASNQASKNCQVKFVLFEAIGRQLFFAERYKEALYWFLQALEQTIDSFDMFAVETAIRTSQCYAIIEEENRQKPIEYCKLAVRIAEYETQIIKKPFEMPREYNIFIDLPHLLIKALGELAIAYWLAGNLKEAFKSLDRAASFLFPKTDIDDQIKDILVRLAYVSGYLKEISISNEPLCMQRKDKCFPAPTRGYFFTFEPNSIEKYNEENVKIIPFQLASFAEAVAEDEKAYTWADFAIESDVESNFSSLKFSMLLIQLPQMISDREYYKSLIILLENAKIKANALMQAGYKEAFSDSLSMEHNIELLAVQYWSIVIAFHLYLLMLENRDMALIEANQISDICKMIKSETSYQDFWEQLSLFFSSSFSEEATAKDVVQQYNGTSNHVLEILCYLTATLLPGITIQECYRIHLRFIPEIIGIFNSKTIVHRNFILPFMEKFWTNKVRFSRFALRTPDLVERNLKAALDAPVEVRLKRILQAVLDGFYLQLHPNMRKWLFDT